MGAVVTCKSAFTKDRDTIIIQKLLEILGLAAILGLLPASAMAQAPVGAETGFVLNTFAFLFWGALVMWMCAGFTMLEAGSVRTKNASVICMKNIGLYSIAGLAYYVIGYNIMYVDVGRRASSGPSRCSAATRPARSRS